MALTNQAVIAPSTSRSAVVISRPCLSCATTMRQVRQSLPGLNEREDVLPGKHLSVSIHALGVGVAGDDVPHGFSPFFITNFTIKEGAGGMGIGLFITKKVIENHAGTISITNASEGGAVARVTFPRITAPAC